MDELKATEFKRSLENAKTCRELMLVLKVRPTAVTELITIIVTKLFFTSNFSVIYSVNVGITFHCFKILIRLMHHILDQ